MKNFFSIAGIGIILLLVWAFFTGKIKMGFASSQPGMPDQVQKQEASNLTTSQNNVIHNPNNVKTAPVLPVYPIGPKRQSNVSVIRNNPVATTSDYSLKVNRPASIQIRNN